MNAAFIRRLLSIFFRLLGRLNSLDTRRHGLHGLVDRNLLAHGEKVCRLAHDIRRPEQELLVELDCGLFIMLVDILSHVFVVQSHGVGLGYWITDQETE